jgi:soluble lytic murein transglycosylase-like protein
VPLICRYSSALPPSPAPIPSSFPVMAWTVETKSALSRHLAAAAFVIATAIASMLVIDRAASAERAPPIVARENGSAADPLAAFIAEASQRCGVPASWIRAVMRVESIGDVHALSRKGAMGLMQIMPETWALLLARYDLGANPYDPHDNILAGAAYLRELNERYGAPGCLAAYDAGPARYEEHLASGRSLPAETRAYVAALAPMIAGERADGALIVAVTDRSWTKAPLFPARAESTPADAQPTSGLHVGDRPTAGAVENLTALTPQSGRLFVRPSHWNSKP